MRMRTPLNALVAGVLSIGLVLPALAQTYNGQQLQGHVTYVPVGTTLDAALTSPIDSALAKPGDLFNAKLNAPLSWAATWFCQQTPAWKETSYRQIRVAWWVLTAR